MSDATRKTPLETARECCGKHLHDRGTDRLLAAIAAAPDRDMTLAEAEAAMYEHTRYFTIRLERAWETNDRPRSTKWSVCASRGTGCEFRLFEYESLRTAVHEAIEYMRPAKLPTAHEVTEQVGELPERFCECTGGFGLETDHDRHNDDDAQRAAQERADAEGGEL